MDTRARDLRRAVLLSWLSVLLGAGIGVVAVALAIVTGGLALLGFGADAAIDATASVALIWRFTIERRQPHRAARVENVAETIVGGTLILLAGYLVFGAVRSLIEHREPDQSTAALVLLLASVIALPSLALAKRRVAERLASGALRADSILTGVAALLAGLSLASSALASGLGFWFADAVAALMVSAVLAREGFLAVRAARARRPFALDE